MTAEELSESLTRLAIRSKHGCGNHGCRIKSPQGQGTNMTCRCTPAEFSKILMNIAVELERNKDWKPYQPNTETV